MNIDNMIKNFDEMKLGILAVVNEAVSINNLISKEIPKIDNMYEIYTMGNSIMIGFYNDNGYHDSISIAKSTFSMFNGERLDEVIDISKKIEDAENELYRINLNHDRLSKTLHSGHGSSIYLKKRFFKDYHKSEINVKDQEKIIKTLKEDRRELLRSIEENINEEKNV